MSELHKFIFEGLPVRGMLVRLTDAWQEVLRRRRGAGGYPPEVEQLLGQMAAAGVLMQGNIKFNGALVLQISGDGPVKLAVAEVQSDLSFRATVSFGPQGREAVPAGASLSQMVNVDNRGRCVITLDPKDRLPGQQPYQGVVPLFDDRREKLEELSQVLEHYMLQSEQLDTCLVLAANAELAAGLLIQRLPVMGQGNLAGQMDRDANEDQIGRNEDYQRIAMLAATLRPQELLSLSADQVLHRLFWQEPIIRFEPQQARFACTCSRQRVGGMLRGLGRAEVEQILTEQGRIEVGCEFCGVLYHFDAVDSAQVFAEHSDQPPAPGGVH